MTPPNLLGQQHEHSFTVPFRGVLMCENDYCGACVEKDVSELTEDRRRQIRDEIQRDVLAYEEDT